MERYTLTPLGASLARRASTMQLIELTNEEGGVFSVNPETVCTVYPRDGKARITYVGDPCSYVTREPYDDVVAKLTGRKPSKEPRLPDCLTRGVRVADEEGYEGWAFDTTSEGYFTVRYDSGFCAEEFGGDMVIHVHPQNDPQLQQQLEKK